MEFGMVQVTPSPVVCVRVRGAAALAVQQRPASRACTSQQAPRSEPPGACRAGQHAHISLPQQRAHAAACAAALRCGRQLPPLAPQLHTPGTRIAWVPGGSARQLWSRVRLGLQTSATRQRAERPQQRAAPVVAAGREGRRRRARRDAATPPSHVTAGACDRTALGSHLCPAGRGGQTVCGQAGEVRSSCVRAGAAAAATAGAAG